MPTNIEILKNLAKNGVITHNGRFHADDILSAILLKISGVIDNISKIQRVGRVPEYFDGLAFDIGGGKFDHHQEGAKERQKGKKYAAFGLLWQEIGTEYIQNTYHVDEKIAKNAAKKFDSDFVRLMDLTDNYGAEKYPNPLSLIISSQNNTKYSDQENKQLFEKISNDLESYIVESIENSCNFIQDKIKAKKLAVSDFIIMDIDNYIDRNAFVGTRVKYIVKKSHRGTYNITTVEPYKIPSYCNDLPGCIQVYKIGAAFDSFYNALVATKKFVTDIRNK